MELDIHNIIHERDQHLSGDQTDVMTRQVLKDQGPCKLSACCIQSGAVC